MVLQAWSYVWRSCPHHLDRPSIDSVRGNEQELGVEGEAAQGNMDLDGQLTQEQFHSSQSRLYKQ